MVFPKKYSPIRDTIWRVSWWLTSVSWWECERYGPARIVHRPMVNVKDSIPPWSICLGPYPRKRSQSGRITLEHWSMRTTTLETQPQGSAPTTSCLVDDLAFQLMWHLVWLHAPSRSQIQLGSLKSWEIETSGLIKKQRPFKLGKLRGINEISIKGVKLRPWRLGTWS